MVAYYLEMKVLPPLTRLGLFGGKIWNIVTELGRKYENQRNGKNFFLRFQEAQIAI